MVPFSVRFGSFGRFFVDSLFLSCYLFSILVVNSLLAFDLASPSAVDFILPAQSPHSEFKLLSDALASPVQSTSSGARMAPSSREWYTKAPLAGGHGDARDISLFNSPSSGTRGSVKRRSKNSNLDEMGIGLFPGDNGDRPLRHDDPHSFSPKLLQSPDGIPSILSPGDGEGYRSGGRGNVGIAFKGVDFHEGFDNFDSIQTVSSSSGSKDSFSSSSSYSPTDIKGRDIGESIGAESSAAGRGLRKRKASRKGRGDAADVSPVSDHMLMLDSDSHDSNINSKTSSNNSDSSAAARRKGRANASSAKVDSGTGRFNASPVRNFNNHPRSVTPSAEGKSQVKCNCKKSKCLKLYCDCFRVSKYCEDCNCVDCNNCVEREHDRLIAVNNILERNPDAFAPRIKQDSETMSKGHLSGCHCKKSACLKKYCECFSAAVACSDKCRCMDCRNSVEHVAAMSASKVNTVSVSPPANQFGSQSNAVAASSEIDDEMLMLAD